MARAIVQREGIVLLKYRKVGEIIEHISPNDIRRFRKYVKEYKEDVAEKAPTPDTVPAVEPNKNKKKPETE
jgi:hypothetical protein